MIFAGLVSGVPGNGPAEFNVFPSQVISPRAFQMKQGDDSKDFLQGLWSVNWYIFVHLLYSDLCIYSVLAVDAAVVRTQIDGEVLQAERDNPPFQVNW